MAPLAPRPATLGWSVIIGLIVVLLATGVGWVVSTATVATMAAVAGPTGETGSAGPTGDTGPTGPQGQDGAAGATGATGPTGTRGQDGPAGVPGAAGARGGTGAAGAVGPTGDAGPRGVVGARGASGPVGADGERGPRGAAGPAGPPGVDGAMGAPGDGAVIVRTANPGDESTVATGPLAAGVWLLTAASTIVSHAENPYFYCYFDVTENGTSAREIYVTDHVFRDRTTSYTASMVITVPEGVAVSVYSGCVATDQPGDIETRALTTSATMVGGAP